MTNADKIRRKNNDELARFLKDNGCPIPEGTHCNAPMPCYDCIKEWLESEAKEDDQK